MAIQQLIAFVAHYDPEFPKKIRGAAPHKIAELERLAGQRLPAFYHECLLAMGDSMDWLQPTQARFDIDTLLQYYNAESWRPPPGYLKIGLGDNDPFFDIYLESDGGPEPRVVTMPHGPTNDFEKLKKSFRHPLAGSLEEYLGTSAYRTSKLDTLPNALRIAGNDPSQPLLARTGPVLAQLGLKPFWFSNDWVQVFDSRQAGAITTQFPGGVLAIDLAAQDPETLGNLRRTLLQNFALPHTFPLRGRAEI
jgi:hypothetical protein